MSDTHPRTSTGDQENPHAGQGSVLLDIGGDIGALVVEMPPGTEGLEVEIRPRGAADLGDDATVESSAKARHYPHVAVVNRPTQQQPVPSLVFPELCQGDYELIERGGRTVRAAATVTGGQVTYAAWQH